MSSPVQESGPCNILPSPKPEISHNNETGDITTDTDSDNNDKSNSPVAGTKRRSSVCFFRMLNLCKEVTVMVLIAVAYAALTNETLPKVSKSPAAYPFFPKDSLVTDWYRGQITEAIEKARASDIAFVMFYAPWDAESQAVRKHFEQTAKFMHKQVAFASINCWQPGSECKRQYSKVYKWPVLIAYPTHGRGIQYNGPLEAFHMIKFLQNICKPIVRLHQGIDDFISKYDTVILANISVLPGSYEYAVFYSTALRFLERDPFREIIFAVLPQKQDVSPSIQLYIWNGTIKYEADWSPDSLSSWILKNLQYATSWVSPTSMKSLMLAGFMQPGPTLILFTPKNPLLQEIDYYNMLREIAYEYYNCKNDFQITTKQRLINTERQRNRENYQKLKQNCLHRETFHHQKIVANSTNDWTNSSQKDICNCVTTICHEDENYIGSDYESLEYLRKSVLEDQCEEFLLAQKYAQAIFEKNVADSSVLNITGLACKTNLTLGFIALDSLRFYHFAEKFGVNLLDSPEKSGVIIVDDRMEIHHVMHDHISGMNIRLFIHNFTQRMLLRSLHSKVHVKTKNHHVYPLLNCSKSNQFCVAELSSDDFLDIIMQPNKVVIVFYYSKQCSFCNGIAYVFLTVAKMLSTTKDIVFARIDGDTNLLPWEYTMETYPTILFFPASRKSESRAFARNIPITVPNLIGFILTNVEPELKLKTMWSICCQTKFIDEKLKCVSSIRTETLTVIDKTLKEWRISPRKQKVLYKLQVLKNLHLLFAHSPNKILQIQSYLSKLRD